LRLNKTRKRGAEGLLYKGSNQTPAARRLNIITLRFKIPYSGSSLLKLFPVSLAAGALILGSAGYVFTAGYSAATGVPRANAADAEPLSFFAGLKWPHLPKFFSFIGPPKAIPLAIAEVLKLVHISADKHRVPAEFVNSIIAAESNFNSEAVSPKGAIGLMQLMPATAKQYGADPRIPGQNVDAGTHYLRVLMDRYGSHNKQPGDSLKRVIAAYNAGPGMVDRYRGVPPFRETRGYVVRVLGFLQHARLKPTG
jgi:soluble lytic murein transglycosylase-like protein